MAEERVLVIDDETSIRSSLQGILEDEGFTVRTAATGEAGLALPQDAERRPRPARHLAAGDERPGRPQRVRDMDEPPPVVVISGHGTVETAVAATKLGAFDFLEKPLSLEKVVLTVRNALRQHRLEEENIQLRERVRARYHLVGKSAGHPPAAERDREGRADERPRPDHRRERDGQGADRPPHPPQEPAGGQALRRDQLRGHPRRADRERAVRLRPGASLHPGKDKKGKLLQADGGTLFLDEIGDMSLKTQARLVKAMVEQKYEPAGGGEPVTFDTRVIAATTRSLKELISKGRFREDIFFRLNVIPMAIPPLRERPEDIPLLIAYYLRHYSLEYGKKPKSISAEALKAFLNYSLAGQRQRAHERHRALRDPGRGRDDRRRPPEPARRDAGAGAVPGLRSLPHLGRRRPEPSSASTSTGPWSGTAGTWPRPRPTLDLDRPPLLREKIQAHRISFID